MSEKSWVGRRWVVGGSWVGRGWVAGGSRVGRGWVAGPAGAGHGGAEKSGKNIETHKKLKTIENNLRPAPLPQPSRAQGVS